jgi:hypothetical protein
MSYGEIGRVPIDVVINVRMISFWNKLLTYNQKLSSILYRIMYMLSQRENVNFKSINHIKSIFDNVGLSYVWNQQNPIHLVEVKLIVKQKLTNQFIQKWYNLIATSFRGNYLLKLSPNERALITKLRCCNLKIPVETGR